MREKTKCGYGPQVPPLVDAHWTNVPSLPHSKVKVVIEPLKGSSQQTLVTIPYNTPVHKPTMPNSMNKGPLSTRKGGFQSIGSIGIKYTYSYVDKSMVETTQKGNEMLV